MKKEFLRYVCELIRAVKSQCAYELAIFRRDFFDCWQNINEVWFVHIVLRFEWRWTAVGLKHQKQRDDNVYTRDRGEESRKKARLSRCLHLTFQFSNFNFCLRHMYIYKRHTYIYIYIIYICIKHMHTPNLWRNKNFSFLLSHRNDVDDDDWFNVGFDQLERFEELIRTVNTKWFNREDNQSTKRLTNVSRIGH